MSKINRSKKIRDELDLIRQRLLNGETVKAIAATYNVAEPTLYQLLISQCVEIPNRKNRKKSNRRDLYARVAEIE